MVRHKTRWLLVQLDFEPDMAVEECKKRKRGETSKLDTIVIYRAIKESFYSCFGIAAYGFLQSVQGKTEAYLKCKNHRILMNTHPVALVRYYDEHDRLAVIRVPREGYGMVRASILFLTLLQSKSVVASVISVNGSARTARLATITEVQRRFRGYHHQNYPSKKEVHQLDLRLQQIQAIE